MIRCPKCGQELPDGTKFCRYCGCDLSAIGGAQQQAPVYQAPQQNYYENSEAVAAKAPADTVNELLGKVKEIFAKVPKKILIAAVAAILVIVILISVISIAGQGKNNFALYVKEGEMFFSDFSGDPMQVTTNLMDMDDYDNDEEASVASQLSSYCVVSKNEKEILYVDKISDSDDGANLYYRSLKNERKDPEKIASDVDNFVVDEKFKTIVYHTTDGDLYEHDFKERSKIASEVEYFYTTADCKTVVYSNEDDDLYRKESGKDKEKIGSEIESFRIADEKFELVYFISDDTLYLKDGDKDKEKIASDASDILAVYESGEFYFTKEDTSEVKLMDYVTDDKKDSDAKLTEPTYPTRPYSWDYDSDAAYQKAYEKYEKDYEKYEKDLEEYYAKENRDDLREELADYSEEITITSLYFYNGKEEVLIAESVGNFDYSYDKPVIAYSSTDSESSKLKLSEIDSVYDVTGAINGDGESSGKTYIAVEDKSTALEIENAESFTYTEDCKTVYFVVKDEKEEKEDKDAEESKTTYTLYSAKISGSKVKSPEVYDTDVSTSYPSLIGDKVKYFKDVKESKGTLFIDKEEIDSDVSTYRTYYSAETDTLYYYTDWSSKSSSGTLKESSGKKGEEIASDVYTFQVTPGGKIYYLADYSTKSYKGDLYLAKGGDHKKIDQDVSGLVPIHNATSFYDYDNWY